MNSLKELKGVSYVNTPVKKSKGQLFKEKHGYSLTFLKNVVKFSERPIALVSTVDIDAYKAARKARKKTVKREWQKRREASAIHMRTKGAKRKTKHKGRAKSGSAAKPYVAPKI